MADTTQQQVQPDIEAPDDTTETPKDSLPHEDPIRAAVAAAYDKAEVEAPEVDEGADDEGAPTAPAAGAPQRARDPATGKFLPVGKPAGAQPAKPAAAPGQAKAPAAPAPAAGAAPVDDAAERESRRASIDRAPQSWKQDARVEWQKLPPSVKAEVVRLERERETVLREAAPARKLAETFQEVVRPYEGFIRAAGHTPMQSVAELMKTAAALRTLPDWEKAVLVAGIVRAHNVAPENLFAALMNEGPLPGGAGQPPPQQQFRDPRVDQLLAEVHTARSQSEAAAEAAAESELDAFIVQHPLAGEPDVQTRMARAMDLASADGVDLDWEQAYLGVLAVDPELRAIAEQQAAASATNPPKRSTARAEAAASSVRPSPVAQAPQALRGKSVEDHVRAAFDKVHGRT